MYKKLFLIFASLFFFSISAQAVDRLIFDADFMERNTKKNTVSLKGNVNVVFQTQHLLCDEATIDQDSQMIHARGNVILQTPDSTLRGEKMELNYATNKGQVENGIITSGQVLIESELIEKVGEKTYWAKDAYYTACISCPPSWGFTSRKLRAEMGGYAYIYRPWLYLLQLPVLPLPYLVVPLNSKRQTGFLVPRPNITTQGGWGVQQPFFWAIDRSHDATIAVNWYERRGIQTLLEYRYVTTPTSSGEFNFGVLKDRGASDEIKRRKGDNKPSRWFMDYIHHYELPNDFIHRAQVQMAGDPEYGRDFPEQFPYFGEPAFDNRTSFTKNFASAHMSLDASYYISQTEAEIRPDNEGGIHRIPQFNFISTEKQLVDDFPLMFQWSSRYLNVGRQGAAFDSLSRASLTDAASIAQSPGNQFTYYDPATETGDIIRSGQRLDNIARVSYPFWIGDILDMEPSVLGRYTQYSLGVPSDAVQAYDSFPSRTYVQFNMSSRTYFNRVFDAGDNVKYKHSIIPRVDYRVIPIEEQSNHRFFGTQDNIPSFREKQPVDNLDIDIDRGGRGLQFDSSDRTVRRHLVNFSLANKIFRKETEDEDGNATYNRFLLMRLSQAYDLKEAEQSVGRPWQDIIGTLDLRMGKFNLFGEFDYFPYHSRTNISSSAQYYYWNSNFVSLGYTIQYSILEDPSATTRDDRTDAITLGTGIYSEYFDLNGQIVYSPRQSEFTDTATNLPRFSVDRGFVSWSANAIIKPPGRCWLVRINVMQALSTPYINFSISPEFQFGL